MSRIRSLLVPLTAAWLSVHLLAISAGTIVALTSGSSPSNIVCTCGHGADHGSCPMHRTSTNSTRCRLQGTQNDLGLALMSVLGPVVMPSTVRAAFFDSASPDSVGYSSPLFADWMVPPEPPPPRS